MINGGEPVKLLFIGGAGRSGSTLIETILGQLDHVVSLGEFNEVWKAGCRENRLCGCGSRFLSCPFWTSALRRCGVTQTMIGDIISAQDQSCRIRHLPKMLYSSLRTDAFAQQFSLYSQACATLLRSIVESSGAHVLIDSSKTPAHLHMLSLLSAMELHVLELVRDSRGVAYSWQRRKAVPDLERGNPEMVRMSAIRSATDWNIRHALVRRIAHLAGDRISSFQVLRYEDFVRSPIEALSRILKGLNTNLDPRSLFAGPHTVRRRLPVHTLEGNPSKFRQGDIQISADQEWRTKMPLASRALVTALTAPYLRKFEYI